MMETRRLAGLAPALAGLAATAFGNTPIEWGPRQVVVTWSHDLSGSLQAFDFGGDWTPRSPVIAAGRDAVLHSAWPSVFAVSSESGVITQVDTRDWTVTQVLSFTPEEQVADIAVAGPQRAYIARRGATHLLRWNPRRNHFTESVDLSPLADADGLPEMSRMVVHEGRLFIQLQRITGQEADGVLAVVDLADETLIDVRPDLPGVQGIELSGAYPRDSMQIVPETRSLYVAATGFFSDHGSVEEIDLDSLANRGRVLIEGVDGHSADITAFVFTRPDGGLFCYSTDFDQSSHLHRFTHPGGWIPGPDLHKESFTITQALRLHAPTRTLLLAARHGVRAFHAETIAVLDAGPVIPTPQPPVDILLVPAPYRQPVRQ